MCPFITLGEFLSRSNLSEISRQVGAKHFLSGAEDKDSGCLKRKMLRPYGKSNFLAIITIKPTNFGQILPNLTERRSSKAHADQA